VLDEAVQADSRDKNQDPDQNRFNCRIQFVTPEYPSLDSILG
jgi:hypothetical protein